MSAKSETIYVIDTSSFIVLGHYFPKRFPTFWEHLDVLSEEGRLTSVSEVLRELDNHNAKEHLATWIKHHDELFPTPTSKEMNLVAKIFAVREFQSLISQKKRLEGTPVADPFVIARAWALSACVITEESASATAVRIPGICKHFKIDCTNLEGLMTREGWEY